MSKWYGLVVVSVFVVACTANAEVANQAPIGPQTVRMETTGDSGVKAILELMPVSFLFSPDIDGFSASNYYYEETIEGTGSWIPSGRAGVSIGNDDFKVDITGGMGYLWNNAFAGPFYLVDVAAPFRLNNKWAIGPHAGILYFSSMEWQEDADLDFSETTGWMAGVITTLQFRGNFYGFLSLDYLSAKLDVEPGPEWTVSDSSLDLTGFAVQAGIAWRF